MRPQMYNAGLEDEDQAGLYDEPPMMAASGGGSDGEELGYLDVESG